VTDYHVPALCGLISSILAGVAAAADPVELLFKLNQAFEWRDTSLVRSEYQFRFHDVVDGRNERRASGWSEWAEGGGRTSLKLFTNAVEADDHPGHLRYVIGTADFTLHWQGSYVQFIDVPHPQNDAMLFSAVFVEAGHFLSGRFLAGIEEWPILDLRELHRRVEAGELRLDPQVGREVIGDLECSIVRLEGNQMKLTLWLAPERGCNPVRVLMDTTQLPGQGAGTQELRDVTFMQDDQGRWLLKSGTLTIHFPRYSEGRGRAGNYSVHRTHVDTDPELDEKRFEIPEIPDGTEVGRLVRADSGELVPDPVRHQWKDGKPVPAYSPEAVERIRRRVEEVKRAREQQQQN
jgi:hypothetical protein